MTSPPNDGSEAQEPVSFDKPAADPTAAPAESAFDPYRFGAPDHPVPPEFAPPGYVPPAPQPAEQPVGAPPPYQPYAGGPAHGYPTAGYPNYPPAGYPGQGYQQYPGQFGQPGQPGQSYYPPPTPWTQYPQPKTGNGRAIAALVLGIVSIVFFWTSIFDIVPVVLAIVFGSIAINDARKGATGRSMAISGIVCGVIGALLAVTFTVVVYTRIKTCLDNYDQGSSAQNTCIRHKL